MSDVDEDAMRAFLPASFGKQVRETPVASLLEQSKRKVEEQLDDEDDDEAETKDEEEDDEVDDDDDSDEDEEEFPVSHEMVIKTHDRAVTTVTLDSAGARLISGSTDCTLKLHDFSSMTPSTIRAFKSVDPTATKASAQVETHAIHQALFNPISPRQLLVITATSQARILTRDGDQWATFVKGDMYLRDMHNTKGHVSEVTSGAWHPTNPDLCVTAGNDSTLRIWDVNNTRSQKEVIVHKPKSAGSAGRTRMTAVGWSSTNQGGPNLLVAAAYDGSLAMWSGDGPYTRPAAEIRDAHKPDTWTGGLDISADGRLVVTRGGDDTIKVWDTRKFKMPVNTVEHLSTSLQHPTTNICFAPNSASIITGSADGRLHILNPATLRPELVTPVTPGSPLITVLWHPRLNQMITGSANGETHILYSPNLSSGGAKTVMSKAAKRRHIDDDPNLTMDLSQGLSTDNQGAAVSYAARHPNVGMTASGKSKDPRRPHIPAQTPFAKSQPDENYVKNNIKLSGMREEDPREALLKYAQKAKDDPLFTKAWSKTQPKTIYADLSEEEDNGDEEQPSSKRVKR